MIMQKIPAAVVRISAAADSVKKADCNFCLIDIRLFSIKFTALTAQFTSGAANAVTLLYISEYYCCSILRNLSKPVA